MSTHSGDILALQSVASVGTVSCVAPRPAADLLLTALGGDGSLDPPVGQK